MIINVIIKAKRGGSGVGEGGGGGGVAAATGGCRSSNWGVSQQQLGGVAAVKGGVALDRPYIYTCTV